MAFRRKKSWFRGARRSKIPASRIPRSIARVRRQKVVAFNTMQVCEHTCVLEDGENCTTSMTIALVRNTELQELFGDNCKVARISGAVHIDPWYPPPYTIASGEYGETSDWLTHMNLLSRTILQGRAGLVKTMSNSEDPTNPLPDYVIANSFDWSEAPWIRQWNHMWINKETYSVHHRLEGAPLGVCSDVFKPDSGSVVNALAAGTGNINTQTGAIGTTCIPIFETTDDGNADVGIRTLPPARPWRIPLNIRKDITLKENQNLEMKLSFSTLSAGTDCYPFEDDPCELTAHGFPCLFRVIPNVMLTIQYG